MVWTSLRRILTLKLTGGIPWLYVAPILAAIIELSIALVGYGPRLPYSLTLMFLVAFFLFLAHIAYSLGCPPNLKDIGSQDEWAKITATKRTELRVRVEQDKVLLSVLLVEAEKLIDERLAPAFAPSQMTIIKRELLQGIQSKANFIGETIIKVGETSFATFDKLNKENPAARWICTVLIAVAFVPLLAVFALRFASVYHATFG